MGAHWYFDFVSPFSYLHWQKVRPLVEAGRVEAVPIVFGAVLHALGILGPAEIPKKREFIYRQALWQARRDGVPLRFPPAHPFNPLPALRLCVAAGATPPAIGTVFEAIWAEGLAGDAPLVLDGLAARLGLADAATAIADPVVKDRLRANTDAALAAEIERVRARPGVAILYDCHSIRSVIPFLFDGVLPDFNIGTANGTSCAPASCCTWRSAASSAQAWRSRSTPSRDTGSARCPPGSPRWAWSPITHWRRRGGTRTRAGACCC